MLYGDLGINTQRKKNFYAELMDAYFPRDFAGVVDEWMVRKGLKGSNGYQNGNAKEVPVTKKDM